MTFAWATLQTDLPAFLGELLTIPCDYRTQPLPFRDVTARAWVDVLDIAGVGVDESVWKDASATTVQQTIKGQREATVQVTVWSQSQELAASARFYLSRLRSRLRWETSLTALKALGLAHVRTESIVQLDPIEDQRIWSRAAMDLRVAFAETEADEEIPFIEFANVSSSSVRNPAGTPLGVQVTINTDPTP